MAGGVEARDAPGRHQSSGLPWEEVPCHACRVPHAPDGNTPRLLAISDLHVAYPENRELIEDLRPGAEGDWLLLAGDVGEIFADIEWALRTLSSRFATV